MKTYIDFFETFKGEMIGTKRFRNKFIRLWGTETVDGVKVLKKRFTIYPGYKTDKNIQRMCKMLGIWSQVKEAKFNTIAGYYLWLNPKKGDTTALAKELLAEKVDEFAPYEEWKTSIINYTDKQNPDVFKDYTKEQILTYIDNDYRNIFSYDNGFVVGDTLAETALGKYVLFDDGTEFEVEVVSSTVTAVPAPNISTHDWYIDRTADRYYTGLSIEIRYRRITIDTDPDGLLITAMIEEQEENRIAVLQELQRSSRSSDSENEWGADDEPVTDEIWYNDQLRYEAITQKGIKTAKLIEPILFTLDTGQIQKKVKWYKRILGFVLIVIAIVIAVVTGGSGAALAAAIATAVGVATLVMVLIQAQWAKSNAAAAGYMGRWVKVANIISIAAGITAIIQNMAKAALVQAAQEGAKEGTKEAAKQVALEAAKNLTVGETIKYAAQGLMNNITGFFTGAAGEFSMEAVMTSAKEYLTANWKSIGFRVANMAMDMRQKEMNNDLQDTREYAAELAEQLNDSDDKRLDIGLKDLQVYAEQLEMVKSRYDYDFQYEREIPGIHIGNIQRSSNAKYGMNLRAEGLA